MLRLGRKNSATTHKESRSSTQGTLSKATAKAAEDKMTTRLAARWPDRSHLPNVENGRFALDERLRAADESCSHPSRAAPKSRTSQALIDCEEVSRDDSDNSKDLNRLSPTTDDDGYYCSFSLSSRHAGPTPPASSLGALSRQHSFNPAADTISDQSTEITATASDAVPTSTAMHALLKGLDLNIPLSRRGNDKEPREIMSDQEDRKQRNCFRLPCSKRRHSKGSAESSLKVSRNRSTEIPHGVSKMQAPALLDRNASVPHGTSDQDDAEPSIPIQAQPLYQPHDTSEAAQTERMRWLRYVTGPRQSEEEREPEASSLEDGPTDERLSDFSFRPPSQLDDLRHYCQKAIERSRALQAHLGRSPERFATMIGYDTETSTSSLSPSAMVHRTPASTAHHGPPSSWSRSPSLPLNRQPDIDSATYPTWATGRQASEIHRPEPREVVSKERLECDEGCCPTKTNLVRSSPWSKCYGRDRRITICKDLHTPWETVESKIQRWAKGHIPTNPDGTRGPLTRQQWKECFKNFRTNEPIQCAESPATSWTAHNVCLEREHRCPRICLRFAENDPNLIVLHIEHEIHRRSEHSFPPDASGRVSAEEMRSIFTSSSRPSHQMARIMFPADAYPLNPVPEMECFRSDECTCLYDNNKRSTGNGFDQYHDPSDISPKTAPSRRLWREGSTGCSSAHQFSLDYGWGNNGRRITSWGHYSSRGHPCLVTNYERDIRICHIDDNPDRIDPSVEWIHALDPVWS